MKTPPGSTNSFEKAFLAPKIKVNSWSIFNGGVQTKKPIKKKSPINLSNSPSLSLVSRDDHNMSRIDILRAKIFSKRKENKGYSQKYKRSQATPDSLKLGSP